QKSLPHQLGATQARMTPTLSSTNTNTIASPIEETQSRRLRVRHHTPYQYDRPVPRSVHRVHLRPIDDWKQTVLSYRLNVTPAVPLIAYEDVFGTGATRSTVEQPYTELTIESESLVEIRDSDPFAFTDLPIRRPSIPLV